jgi:large subunit ribosomal protein L5e
MAYLKIQKKGSYHSRFQLKWRRRREGKTDYYSRKRLISQDKRKYNSPKFRFVVRITKKNIICQFTQSLIEGDHILFSCYSSQIGNQLEFFSGPTAFHVAYFCGVYLANKILAKKEIKSSANSNSHKKLCRSVFAVLDIGLTRATTGNRVFATMKGAIDGGITIPYNEKRLPGYSVKDGFHPPKFLHRALGFHIRDYVSKLKEEDEEKYQIEFGNRIDKIEKKTYQENNSEIKNIQDQINKIMFKNYKVFYNEIKKKI